MAGINNIIGSYNLNPKRISSKLNFEIGQVFAAKIISANELNRELILKLLDGWQFTAELQMPLDFFPEGMSNFQVEGFQDGKLQIKLVNYKDDKQEISKSSLEDLITEGNLDVDNEDYNILKKMVKHEMPLTKENVTKVKTLVNFREKLFKGQGEANDFVLKYVSNKNIDINSDKGKEISSVLKGFFKELTNISEDELLTLLENNIEVNEQNIKSFVKIFRGESSIYREIKAVSDESFKEDEVKKLFEKDIEILGENLEENNEDSSHTKDIIRKEPQKNTLQTSKSETNEVLKSLNKSDSADDLMNEISYKEVEVKLKADNSKIKPEKGKDITEVQVKEQLIGKSEEMKNIIKTLLSEKMEVDSEAFDKVFSMLKEKVNDFKVFNSVSNQYYYMDVPINVNRDEYQCKLLIKDDRKSGKKIDSKNVNMVVSIKTLKIGIVDAYIKVREKNINVDIKCEEACVKILSSGKDIILKELNNLGYSAAFNVSRKEVEMNLSNCRGFFEDNELGSINIRV